MSTAFVFLTVTILIALIVVPLAKSRKYGTGHEPQYFSMHDEVLRDIHYAKSGTMLMAVIEYWVASQGYRLISGSGIDEACLQKALQFRSELTFGDWLTLNTLAPEGSRLVAISWKQMNAVREQAYRIEE